MTVPEHDRAERLDEYLVALMTDPSAEPPAELDPALGETVRRTALGLRPSAPDRAFVARLRHQLDASREGNAARRSDSGWWPFPLGQPERALRLCATLLTIVALALASVVIARPRAARAEEILARAQAAVEDPVAGVQSYALTEVGRTRSSVDGVETSHKSRWWFRAPNRWRYEGEQTVRRHGGDTQETRSLIVVDGENVWTYAPDDNRLTVNLYSPGAYGRDGVSPFEPQITGAGDVTLRDVLAQASTCYAPRVAGEEQVAGRATYIIDLGPSRCPSASVPDANGRRVIWVDQETYLVLRQQTYGAEGNTLVAESVVIEIAYDTPLEATLFTFDIPEGASVHDGRPQPLPVRTPKSTEPVGTPAPDQGAPSGAAATPALMAATQQEALLNALEPLARAAGFPLFVPGDVPQGLTPRLPTLEGDPTDAQLWIEYAPEDEVERDALATLRVVEQRASHALLTNWTTDATPIDLPTGRGWLRMGYRAPGGGGNESVVHVLRDGTLVSIYSCALSPEELWALASGLEAAPGSHAPLPEPTPPTLAELRAVAPHAIYVPTWVPERLTPEPPNGYEIAYHDAEGDVGLIVTNDSGLARDPRHMGEAVALSNGVEAHLLGTPGANGGALLWWMQDGLPVAISGPDLSRDELLRIAASMSADADLGPTAPRSTAEPLTTVPTPTPTPAPPFRVPQPTWLPEPMEVLTYVEGDTVTLDFLPEGYDGMSSTMTLRAFPASLAGSAPTDDPQATVERVADHDVTVVRRGAEACVAYTWDAAALRLTLTNVYDPPGELKYTCDEMTRIVASVE